MDKMDPFRHNFLKQPNDDQYLWRYIKPERIQSFIDGDLYFSPLTAFDDFYESITPLHYYLISFLKRSVSKKFDLSKHISELSDIESFAGQVFMWLNIHDIQKKLTRITGITDEKKLKDTLFNYCENLGQFLKPHTENQEKHCASCWFVGDHVESALMWACYSQPGGIAVNIRFADFKNMVQKSFSDLNVNLSSFGIKDTYSGLIEYKDYNYHEDWLNSIDSGVPLPFFKQHFFKQENEYRLVLHRESSNSNQNSKNLIKVIDDISKFHIILHPTSNHLDLDRLKKRIINKNLIRIDLSEMDIKTKNYTGANTVFK
jgi:hypothetical protein